MSDRPSVLWLSLESVRADHTSVHGYRRETTPALDALSQRPDATAFANGISASIWTPASTGSILTGTHLSTHQVGRDGEAKEKLPAELETLPGLLAADGYDTALFSPNPYIGPETGLDQGFDHVESLSVAKSDFFGTDSLARDSWRCALRRLAEQPLSGPNDLERDVANSNNCLIERRVSRWLGGRGSNPFFTYVHVPSPHYQYDPIRRFAGEYLDELDISETEARAIAGEVYAGSTAIKRRMANGLDLSEADFEALIALYDAEIRYADHTVDRIVRAAEASADGDLVIVVAGDHGDLFGEYGLIGHNLVTHDGLIRVPMLVAGLDGVVDSPDDQTQHIDLTRTVAARCGVESDQFEGRDVRSERRPHAISQRGVAKFETYTEHNPNFDTSRFFAEPFTCVRTADWKYLENNAGRALYDLPDESTDVVNDHPDVVSDLSAVIDGEGVDWTRTHRGERTKFDEQSLDRLRDLGYVS